MQSKSREYTRELTDDEILDLKGKYSKHVKAKRDGFLNTKTKERLLHITKWPEKTSDRDVYDFFYEIRQRAESAIHDFQLLCHVLNENQLQTIFGTKRYKPKAEDLYPISELLNSLTSAKSIQKNQKKKEQIQEEREWRKLILEDVTVRGLLWYYQSGVFKTDIHRRLIKDTMDTLQIMSSGEIKIAPDSTASGFGS